MALIVQKFGGTSVADTIRIQTIAKIILREYEAGHKLVIVVSAMAGVTNSLIAKCSEVSQLNSYEHMQEYDAVVGSGEILTSGLVALELFERAPGTSHKWGLGNRPQPQPHPSAR